MTDKEKLKIWWRKNTLKYRFGITEKDYDFMLKNQKGLCAICKNPPKRIRLAIDHDHKTNIIRGLLCYQCNRLVGMIEKSPCLYKNIGKFLKKGPALNKITKIRNRKSNWKSHKKTYAG